MTPFIISAVAVVGIVWAVALAFPDVLTYMERRRWDRQEYKLRKLAIKAGHPSALREENE